MIIDIFLHHSNINNLVQLIFSNYIPSDLPSHLEAAWSWVEACGSVEAVEQFTVILSTALRLGLPLSQHFTYNLMNKGIGVESMDLAAVPERGFGRPLVPQNNQRSRASRKWKCKARQVKSHGRRQEKKKRILQRNIQGCPAAGKT